VAGIVIHQVKHIKDDNNLDIDPQNILHMGGLRKKLPLNFIAALIGGLALVGLPLTSGYLSKDGILIQAFDWSDNKERHFHADTHISFAHQLVNGVLCSKAHSKSIFWRVQAAKNESSHSRSTCRRWGLAIQTAAGVAGNLLSVPLIFMATLFLYEDAWLYKGFLQAQIF
jgi:NADH-quinone oxidoreductase subunit L